MPVDDVCRVIVLNELTAVIEIEKGVVIEQHYIRRFSVLYKLIVHVKPLLSSAEQMDQAVLLGPGGHALHPETAGGHRAGDGGEDLAADLDLALFILHTHRKLPFLSAAKLRRAGER